MSLHKMDLDLSNFVSTISSITEVECAVFDTNCNLVASTKEYQERKGRNVHSASIEEVLNRGNVIVNNPGYMKSCIGCRFVSNCPSTSEILSCIKLHNTPIGVVSLTSFTKEGHDRINNNISGHMQLIEYVSNIISIAAIYSDKRLDTLIIHKALDDIVDDANSNFFVINSSCSLIYWNKGVEELFSYCNLYTQSIHQMLPEEVVNWIISLEKPSKRHILLETFDGQLHVKPLLVEKEILGYAIELESDINDEFDSAINPLDSIVSQNAQMDYIKNIVRRISSSSSPVLITGETGTGKEMVAKAIHYNGDRKNQPYVAINCANIPDTLFESELFGYEEGAFTGAKKGGKPGIFEMANGGTILLDEIGEVPVYLQSKLLRVLQENTIQRVGSITPRPVDVRIISATNQDLEKMIDEGNFREDLYYRLNVIPIELPPLRHRIDDIDLLSNHFIRKYNQKLNRDIKLISEEAMKLLESYNWPGNVRELENTIEYAINMEVEDTIQINNLHPRITNSIENNTEIRKELYENEYNIIVSALDKNGWDVKGKEKTAKELGISLRTLYRKLEK